MNERLRLIIADDHPFFAEGVSNALSPYEHLQIVATVANGDELLHAIKAHDPQVVILDINMPGKNGIELFKQIREEWPHIKVMLLTMYMPGNLRLDPEQEGIDAYVIKNSGKEVLLTALHELAAGRSFYDPAIGKANGHANDGFTQTLKLSSREKEILQLLKDGASSKEIAGKLYLSELTVKTHRKNMMAKMGAKNVADLIRMST